MDDKEIDKIEQEIFISLKEKITNFSSKEAEKIIEEEVKKRNYLQEDWQVNYAVKRIKEKRDKIFFESEKIAEELEKKKRWWQYRKIGKRETGRTALIGLLGFIFFDYFLKGGLIADIFGLIFWVAGIIWIVRTIQLKVRTKKQTKASNKI